MTMAGPSAMGESGQRGRRARSPTPTPILANQIRPVLMRSWPARNTATPTDYPSSGAIQLRFYMPFTTVVEHSDQLPPACAPSKLRGGPARSTLRITGHPQLVSVVRCSPVQKERYKEGIMARRLTLSLIIATPET